MTDQAPSSAPADPPPHGSGDPAPGTPSPWSRDATGASAGVPGPEPQPWSPPPAGGPGQPYAQPTPSYGPPTPTYEPPTPAYGSTPGQVPGPDFGSYGAGYGQPPAGSPAPGYGVSPYPGGYGEAYPGYGAPAPDHPQATAALITGIAAVATSFFFGIGGLVAIAAIVLGVKARRDIDRDPDRYSGRGKATAGLVLGIVTLVTVVGVVLLGLLVFASSPG